MFCLIPTAVFDCSIQSSITLRTLLSGQTSFLISADLRDCLERRCNQIPHRPNCVDIPATTQGVILTEVFTPQKLYHATQSAKQALSFCPIRFNTIGPWGWCFLANYLGV